jgi:hypothetical protein
MGRFSSPSTQACTCQCQAKRSTYRVELPQSSWITPSVSHLLLVLYLSWSLWIPTKIRFSVAATHVVPRTYIRDPLVIADIKRREERCRQSGGIGTLVVIIQCGSTSQVMPVEVDPPAKIAWDSRDDWANVLSHFVESGRTDFKPISTTPRG